MKMYLFKKHQINIIFLMQTEYLHPRCKMVIRYALESTYQTADKSFYSIWIISCSVYALIISINDN